MSSEKSNIIHFPRMDGLSDAFMASKCYSASHLDTTYCATERLLSNAYRENGLAKKLVDIPVLTAFKYGLEFSEEASSLNKSIHIIHALIKLSKMARLYGSAGLLISTNQPLEELSEPLKVSEKIQSMHVLNRFELEILKTNGQIDCKPILYRVKPNYQYQAMESKYLPAGGYDVHASRLFVIDAEEPTPLGRVNNLGFGDSSLKAAWSVMAKYREVIDLIPSLAKDFIQIGLAVEGLSQDLALNNTEGMAKVTGRFNTLALQANGRTPAIMHDKEHEAYTKHSSSVTGLPELIDRLMNDVSSVANIPVSLLFGRSAAGLNSTGELDIEAFHMYVDGWREERLSPAIDWLLGSLVFLGQLKPDAAVWQWPDLGRLDQKTRAEIQKLNAETDMIYIRTGAVDPVEVFKQRYGGEQYKFEIQIDPDKTEGWAPDAENEAI